MPTKGIEEPLIIFTSESGITSGVNVFQLSGSVVVQPTPYVSISRENIHYGGRWSQEDTITLDGQLTGGACGAGGKYLALSSFKNQLIQNFQENQFGSFMVRENNSVILSAHNCKVESINFQESKLTNLVDYSINLKSYGTGNNFSSNNPMESSTQLDVLEPVDKWSFSENNGKVTLSHDVSARGVFGAGAIENARLWVHGRTGLGVNSSYVSPMFVTDTGSRYGPSPVLMSRRERQSAIEGSYGITESYEFDRTLTTPHGGSTFPHPPLVSTSCTVQSGIDQDFATTTLKVDLHGGWQGIVQGSAGGGYFGTLGVDSRNYGNQGADQLSTYVTGVLGHDLAAEARSLSNISDLWDQPVGFSVDEDEDGNSISLSLSYDNNQMFATGGLDYAYFDYAISVEHDALKKKTNYSLAGEIIARGGTRHKYHNAVNFLDTAMAPNISGYLHGLVRNFHNDSHTANFNATYGGHAVGAAPALPRLNGPETVSIDKNPIEGKITVRASFDTTEEANVTLGEENRKVSDYIEDIAWSWDVTPSLPHYSPAASHNVPGLYMIYDASIMKRIKIQFTLECRAKKCVKYKDAVRIAEKYANYLFAFHIDQKSYVDKGASVNRNEITKAIGVKINGTCKKFDKAHNVITKEQTKIIGKYIN